jgi:manganese/zinc/iron transport system permease protein
MNWDWSLDGWIILVGILCAVSSALVGNFLVLRKMSMLGDAISHAILPGLAVAFFISQSRSSLPMFLGAAIVGVLTAMFTEWIRRFGRVDESASMGVVFTSLFALGLVMIVQAADKVDLDAGCVLYGAIELTPYDTVMLGQFEMPRAALTLSFVTLINFAFVIAFYKELKISSFDASLADAMGVSSRGMHYALMVLVAITAVASFESVGNILVVAMLIVPPATAFLLTRRLHVMILMSVILAVLSAVLGHVSAITVPRWFGYGSTTTAPMMAVATGVFFTLAFLFAPEQGLVVSAIRRFAMSLQILSDDVVAYLFRVEERQSSSAVTATALCQELFCSKWMLAMVLRRLIASGQVLRSVDGLGLLAPGRTRASQLVRSHRLWESYLVTEADVSTKSIHDKAERLEHYTDRGLRDRLDEAMSNPDVDPHGTAIPPEVVSSDVSAGNSRKKS